MFVMAKCVPVVVFSSDENKLILHESGVISSRSSAIQSKSTKYIAVYSPSCAFFLLASQKSKQLDMPVSINQKMQQAWFYFIPFLFL